MVLIYFCCSFDPGWSYIRTNNVPSGSGGNGCPFDAHSVAPLCHMAECRLAKLSRSRRVRGTAGRRTDYTITFCKAILSKLLYSWIGQVLCLLSFPFLYGIGLIFDNPTPCIPYWHIMESCSCKSFIFYRHRIKTSPDGQRWWSTMKMVSMKKMWTA